MDDLGQLLHAINFILAVLLRVNANPDLPASANNRRTLRRWRSQLQATWERWNGDEVRIDRFQGLAWKVITSPTEYVFGYYKNGNPVLQVGKIIPSDYIFFPKMTELLIQAAAQEP